MNADFINPFLAATGSVFSAMLGAEIKRSKPFVRTQPSPQFDVTGIIGLSGKAIGMVALSFSTEMALSITEQLIGQRPPEVNKDVVDAVGELATMIAGAAKSDLPQLSLQVSLPTVVIGNSPCIAFPSRATPIAIPFECQWGSFVVEVGMAT